MNPKDYHFFLEVMGKKFKIMANNNTEDNSLIQIPLSSTMSMFVEYYARLTVTALKDTNLKNIVFKKPWDRIVLAIYTNRGIKDEILRVKAYPLNHNEHPREFLVKMGESLNVDELLMPYLELEDLLQ